MWPVLDEFRSRSSEGSGRKKIERRIAVKPKSADMYVGLPNNTVNGTHVASKVCAEYVMLTRQHGCQEVRTRVMPSVFVSTLLSNCIECQSSDMGWPVRRRPC